jgi:hypothetical protein
MSRKTRSAEAARYEGSPYAIVKNRQRSSGMDWTFVGPVATALFGFFVVHLLNLWRESVARKAQWKRDEEVSARSEERETARTALQYCVEAMHRLTTTGVEPPDPASAELTELMTKLQAQGMLIRDEKVSAAVMKGTQAYGGVLFRKFTGRLGRGSEWSECQEITRTMIDLLVAHLKNDSVQETVNVIERKYEDTMTAKAELLAQVEKQKGESQ